MAIEWDEPTRSFLLTGDGFGYAFAVERDGTPLRHLHWGSPLDRADLARLDPDGGARVGSNTWSRPRAHLEELVAHGGARFDEGALLVEFADGVTALDLRYDGAERTGADALAVQLVDRHRPLDVTVRYEVRGPALCRRLEVGNRGDEPVVLTRAASASWPVPCRPRYQATTLTGGYAAESHVRRQPLGPGRLVLESRRGIPGHAAQPWLAVDGGPGAATEESGEIWSVAVAHGGSWKLVAELSGDGHLHVTAGANDFDARHVLDPGARLTLPDTVGVYAPAGYAGLTARWHDYERRYVLPRPEQARPVLYNSWESTFFDVRHDDQVALAKRARDLGVELFVVDDGWFTDRDDDHGGLGDWRADRTKLPAGVGGLAGEVHALGMRFGLWVEPEAVNPDSDLYRDHPDWVYRWPGRAPTPVRYSYGLDFGRADVRDWAFSTLDGMVREGHVDFLKWDLNRSLTDAPGTAALRHEAGFHAVVDRLRRAHPDLWLETCASGGGRADLATLSRFELAWPSDNTDAFERLAIQDGYAFVHSPQTMSCWVTDSPGYLSKRAIPLRFRFHVAMSGALGIGGRLGQWPAEHLAEAAGYVARYKEIRDTVQLGRRYRLDAGADRSAVCCVAADGAQVAVFVFAQTVRQDGHDPPLRLRGLDPAARYRDLDTGLDYGGAFLTHHGLRPLLSGDYASELVVLSRE
ncbi:MAG: alpha-galactosidase [Micromonosporaceae bacterium]